MGPVRKNKLLYEVIVEMKKLKTVFLILAMAATLTACGKASQNAPELTDKPISTPASVPTEQPKITPTSVPTGRPKLTPTSTPVSTPTPEPTIAPTNTPTPIPTNTPVPEVTRTLDAKDVSNKKMDFDKTYTEEYYSVGEGKGDHDTDDYVSKYSFRTEEVEVPYYVGREDASATGFFRENSHDAVLYLGMPLYLTTAMDRNVYYVSVDDTTVARVDGNELIGLKQGVFTLTTYDKNGKKLEDIKYAVSTYNDSKARIDVASAMNFAETEMVWLWGINKDLDYWKTACCTLMDASYYFQARGFIYSAEGEPEGNSLNGGPMLDWMYNNDVRTIFEGNKGVCLQAAQMAAYLLAGDFEDWGVVCVDGLQGHIFNWFYEDGLYYIMDYTSVISYNAWGKTSDNYADFSSQVEVCESIDDIITYICTEKVDINMNYFVYMYSLKGHDYLPCSLNTAKASSRDAMNGKYEEIIVGYQDCVAEDLHILYQKKGINVKVHGFSLQELSSRILHGRYYLDEEYKYYHDYK